MVDSKQIQSDQCDISAQKQRQQPGGCRELKNFNFERWTLDSGLWTWTLELDLDLDFGLGLWTWTLDFGLWTLDFGLWT